MVCVVGEEVDVKLRSLSGVYFVPESPSFRVYCVREIRSIDKANIHPRYLQSKFVDYVQFFKKQLCVIISACIISRIE